MKVTVSGVSPPPTSWCCCVAVCLCVCVPTVDLPLYVPLLAQVIARRAVMRLQRWIRGVRYLRRFNAWRSRRMTAKRRAFRGLRNNYTAIRHHWCHVLSQFLLAWRAEVVETMEVRACGVWLRGWSCCSHLVALAVALQRTLPTPCVAVCVLSLLFG